MCVGLSGAEGEGAFGICSAKNRPWIWLLVSELFPEFSQPPELKGLISLRSAFEVGCFGVVAGNPDRKSRFLSG